VVDGDTLGGVEDVVGEGEKTGEDGFIIVGFVGDGVNALIGAVGSVVPKLLSTKVSK